MERIMVIGAAGQIGSELVLELRKLYGEENVFATDIKQAHKEITDNGPFQILDVMDEKKLVHFVIRNKITQIYHLAAVLSGNAEKMPLHAWDLNMNSLLNILDLAKEITDIKKLFWPSSIAVFGPSSPKENTPQFTTMDPCMVYGICKLAGERWCEYYNNRYQLDIRSFRYPGLISYKTEPGGGTTDYAVEIFYEAVKKGKYICFLEENTRLPMMFMPDAVRGTIKLMETPKEKLSIHTSYNMAAMSFSPKELADEIRKYIPDFKIEYKPDFRQEIANSWPESIDDSYARANNGWRHEYNLAEMTRIMIEEIRKKLAISQ